MKLNIGCGYRYFAGYINIDSNKKSVADRIMEAHNLHFKSSTAEEIIASQLIEHLGFFRGRYFLSECFRVLKPAGKLIIETPDIEKSFNIFLKGNKSVREAVLTWIYGAESEKMQHRFCFPLELMIEISEEIGFNVLKHESFYYEKNRPSLRLIFEKPNTQHKNQFFATLRKNLLLQNIPDFDNEISASEQEKLLGKLSDSYNKSYKEILYLSIYSVEIVREFFKLKTSSDSRAEKYYLTADYLANNNFYEILLNILKNCKMGGGRQKEAFRYAAKQGINIINKLLKGKEIKFKVNKTNSHNMEIFSEPVLARLSSVFFYNGVKKYYLSHYDEALTQFTESAKVFRNNPFTYWNIARIEKLKGRKRASLSNYKKAILIFETGNIKSKNRYLKELSNEIASP